MVADHCNHSCDPNTWVSVSGDSVQFRPIRPIARGEELTFTYTDLYLPRPDRQEKMLRSHCFTCACERCTDASKASLDDRITGLRCHYATCTDDAAVMPIATGLCSTCGKRHNRGSRYIQQLYMDAVERLQEGETAFKQGQHREARIVFEKLLSDFSDELYKSHLVVYSAYHHLSTLCTKLKDHEAAAGYCREAIRCLEEMFPKYHTETAMMHRDLAFIEWGAYTDLRDLLRKTANEEDEQEIDLSNRISEYEEQERPHVAKARRLG